MYTYTRVRSFNTSVTETITGLDNCLVCRTVFVQHEFQLLVPFVSERYF